MTISAKTWIAIGGLLLAGVGLTIVLSRPERPLEVSSGPEPAKADPILDHPAMQPLDVATDDPSSLETALEKNPGHSPILMRLAELARQKGDLNEAIKHLREAVAGEPGNLNARLELGRALYESGDVEGALRETEQIVERDPNHVDALYNLGAIHANEKQPEAASGYWKRAVAAAPGSPSGQNAQRGLDILGGQVSADPLARSAAIPDIPEHRNVRRTRAANNTVDPKRALIEFATK